MNRRDFIAGLTATAAGLLIPDRKVWALDRTMIVPEVAPHGFYTTNDEWLIYWAISRNLSAGTMKGNVIGTVLRATTTELFILTDKGVYVRGDYGLDGPAQPFYECPEGMSLFGPLTITNDNVISFGKMVDD